MIRLEHSHPDSRIKVVVEVDDDATLSDMIDAIRQFLLGIGYSPSRVLEVLGDD